MKIAITGGIGSGKSYVCRLLEQRGIEVYDCDAAAKRLMRTSDRLQQQLKALVGDAVYSADGVLQKPVLAEFLLASEANKLAINDIVHPQWQTTSPLPASSGSKAPYSSRADSTAA